MDLLGEILKVFTDPGAVIKDAQNGIDNFNEWQKVLAIVKSEKHEIGIELDKFKEDLEKDVNQFNTDLDKLKQRLKDSIHIELAETIIDKLEESEKELNNGIQKSVSDIFEK